MTEEFTGEQLGGGPSPAAEDLLLRFNRDVLPLIPMIFNGAKKYTQDAEAAADLAQDTIVKAFAAFHQFEDGTNVKAWLFRILHNTYISDYRKRKAQPYINSFEDLEEWQLDDVQLDTDIAAPSAESEALRNLPDVEVRSALEALPDSFRTAVYLADAEGFSYQEIADILGVPMGTVMSRIHRGRKQLRQSLREVAIERGIKGASKS